MTTKVFTLIVAALFFCSLSFATIRRVGYPGIQLSGVDYPHLYSADAAASAGDTIQIYSGSATPTSGTIDTENIVTFRSPMVGTFYRKPGADKDVYVKVGDTIKAGDVLCIIEAMKLFNEIEFDGPGGKILKVLIEDSSPVEYDQPLFLIEKA